MAGKKGVGASAPTQINVVNAETLRVGPDEVLILRLPEMGDEYVEIGTSLVEYLSELGLRDRVLVLSGDVEFAVVKKDG